MQQIQQRIDRYHILFLICLIICIMCFMLSIFLFLKFNIRNIFDVRTGYSVKRTVRWTEQRNTCIAKYPQKAEKDNTEPLYTDSMTDTTVIAGDWYPGVLTLKQAQEETDESFGKFRIEKYRIFIHTDEVI